MLRLWGALVLPLMEARSREGEGGAQERAGKGRKRENTAKETNIIFEGQNERDSGAKQGGIRPAITPGS